MVPIKWLLVISVEKIMQLSLAKVIPKSNDYLIDKFNDKIVLEVSVLFNFRGIWNNGNWHKSRI